MATAKKTTEVAPIADTGGLPAYLSGKTGMSSGLQGLEASDFVVPRVKLLQAISEEVTAHDDAKPGIFWLNVLDQPLGPVLDFVPISNKKRYLLMPPIGDDRGILARADDAIHWNPPNGEWQVKLKNVKNPVTWKTAETVRASGLAEFGSSNPDDPDSNPAATLFYEYLVYLPEFPHLSPVLLSLARSQAKKARDLNGKIEFRHIPMQAGRYRATIIQDKGPEGPYFNYQFANNGFATEAEYEACVQYAKKFTDYRGADEEGAARAAEGGDAEAAASGEY